MKPWVKTWTEPSELDQARLARRSLQKARLKLLSPSLRSLDGTMVGTASDLAIAVECLQKLEGDLASKPVRPPALQHALQVEMTGLRCELREVTTLLAGVARFYQGWARLVSPNIDDAPANYTPLGTPHVQNLDRSGKVVAIG